MTDSTVSGSNTKRRYRVTVPDVDYYRAMVKCQAACPVRTDARGYVTAIANGELERAYAIAREPNPLASMCGRICGAPCEGACRRGSLDEPVAIRPLKRVVTELYGAESQGRLPVVRSQASEPLRDLDESPAAWSRSMLRQLAEVPDRRRGRVAMVGAGPASLAAAHDLAILGHQVTIFEASELTGGMIRLGVPSYRIDWTVMDREVQEILDLGVELKTGVSIGGEIKLEDLRRDYDAVFLGIGLSKGRGLNLPGADLDGVIHAVDLLLNFNLGYEIELGERVLVIGGGDVAMDAARTALRVGMADEEGYDEPQSGGGAHEAFDVARTALRLGATDVALLALESGDELPASEMEVEDALEEGVQIHHRVGPKQFLGDNGRLRALQTLDVTSVFDADGRFNPQFIDGSEREWPCDTIVLAIGQMADLAALGGAEDVEIGPRGFLVIDEATGATTAPDVFAGGDIAHGPRLLIHAVRDGHIAALGIERRIQQRDLTTRVTTRWTEHPDHEMPENWLAYQRTRIPSLPVDRRTGITQVELGYDVDQAEIQGLRCLECSVNTVFDGKKCILCNGCVDVCPWDCLKIVSLDSLDGDGSFDDVVATCDSTQSEVSRLPEIFGLAAIIKDDTTCTRCALCAHRCPTGAITMESFRFEEQLSYE